MEQLLASVSVVAVSLRNDESRLLVRENETGGFGV